MRQVSPEATGIFDFIIDLYKSCSGQWKTLVKYDGVTTEELAAFLEYCGHFLYNMGNYWVSIMIKLIQLKLLVYRFPLRVKGTKSSSLIYLSMPCGDLHKPLRQPEIGSAVSLKRCFLALRL